MDRQQRHQDVAAYALGILEPADAYLFEEHLSACVMCAVQLSDFTSLAAALSRLGSPGRIDVRPTPRLLERLTDAIAWERRRERRRRMRLVAAAAALIVTLPVGAVALTADAGGAGPEAPPEQRVTASDPATGVSASVALVDGGSGTSVAMRLAGLAGPSTCRLIAIGKDGVEHPVLSWTVPPGGFGMGGGEGHEGPLDIAGSTGLHTAEIGRWEVRADSGERLLSIG
ncbi:anti-sigma factor family protein [Streptomyces sp. NPDC002889]|uniref:anti-sigma factor family protein n=1 Tax=Streptomyces sp. NPDC002889 TaxID=3364669 RepID=UPI0036757525